MSRRARALAMLGTSVVCAGVAASAANRHETAVNARVGPLVTVVLARAQIAQGALITAGRARTSLEEQRVPERFVPSQALRVATDAVGYRLLAPLSPGDYVSRAQLGLRRSEPAKRGEDSGAAGRGGASRSRSRLVEIPVAGASFIRQALGPGSRVDVLITSDRGRVFARTYLALQDVELADISEAHSDGLDAGDRRGDSTATLRVTLGQAVLLTAAQNFARELRLVPRQALDRRRLRPHAVTAADFGA